MVNDLVLINNIEKRLMERREPIIFPLSPTHRKELRELRDRNVGNLTDRLRTIKQLKKEEYLLKYADEIKLELAKKQKICDSLNKDWIDTIDSINKILTARKKFESITDVKYLNLDHDYDDFCNLNLLKGNKGRKYSFNEKVISGQIADKEFEDKYGNKFKDVQKKIDDIFTKYEEAINFGDLEIVKELYYIMKSADGFFDKISKLEI